MISSLLSRVVILVFGTLFPAYYSYKAVKTKNVKEYVKWMMYWIVFAFFTCLETLTDLFLSFWFPFYYELKILVVLWLLSPATKGSSILYRKFVHPWLTRKEDDIDDYIAKAKQQSYSTVIQLGSKGVNYATNVLMQTAIKGGGGIVNQLRRSYSSGELAGGDMNRNVKALPNIQDPEYDDHNSSGSYDSEPRRVRADSEGTYKARGSSTSRGSRSTKARSADVTDVYYQDVPDEAVQRRKSPRTQDMASRVLSSDDLTSGYSSGDPDLGEALSCKGPAYDDVDLETNASTATTSTTNTNIHNEPPYTTQRSSRVRRTQSLKVSGPERNTLPRSRRTVAEKKVLEERHSVAGTGGGGGGGWEGGRSGEGWPSSYSSTSAAHQGASSFKRSRPGEISAYATLPRTTSKRAAAKKRQV